jgi:hypothetical protein
MSTEAFKREVGMMDLDRLIKTREGVSTRPFDVPEKELLKRAEEIKANERKIFGWVREGQGVREITEKGGYF